MKYKTVFVGSGDFGIPILQRLIEIDWIDLQVVITQPDKPVGRKGELTPTEIGIFCKNNFPRIKVLKPEKFKEVKEELISLQPDIMIVASYGQIIGEGMLTIAKHGTVNFHGSLLPKLRGAVPIQMSILQGFEETGVSLQVMVKAMDAGAIISERECEITQEDNFTTLKNKLSDQAVDIVNDDLKNFLEGKIILKEQNENDATYCFKDDIVKEKAEINSETSYLEAHRMIRAYNEWPVAWLKLIDGKRFKIFGAGLKPQASGLLEGKSFGVYRVDKELFLKLKDGVLKLEKIQVEGKSAGGVEMYLNYRFS